jgi:hypothetical protein
MCRPSVFDCRPEIRATYEIFQDLGQGRYSFRRLRLRGREELSLNFAGHYSGEYLSCRSGGDTCGLGRLLVGGQLSLSDKNASQAIPFYLQETLGGTNFLGSDTLRGFVDYRFRGPNTLLFQLELRRRIKGPVGLMGFYDVGKVAQLRSDIDFSHLRHDIGPGIYLVFSNKVILRAYMGFGGGEGSHPNVKLPSVFQ